MLKYAMALGQAKILLKSLDENQSGTLQNVVRGVVSANVINPDKQPLLSGIADVVLKRGKLSENVDDWITSSEAMDAVNKQKDISEGIGVDPTSFMCPHCSGVTDLTG